MKHLKTLHSHLKQHHKKYLFGIFGTFAVVKMVLLFVGFLGLLQTTNTFAAGVLNSSNIVTTYGCATSATGCDLSYTGITSIALDTFINHTGLITLQLQGNQISSISSGQFNGLSNLRDLELRRNNITSIENGDFNGLSSLTTLNLDQNQITSIESGDFAGLPSLIYLSLGGNQISSIESGDFTGLPSLTGLSLRQNNLTSLGSGIFSGLPGLAFLDLYGNQLTALESSDFNGLSNLITLKLFYNNITSLESGVFNGLPSLTDLEINFSCNTLGSGSISYPGGNTTFDNSNCAVITSTDASGFITSLGDRGYVSSGDAYVGSYAISFASGVTNTMLANTIMQSTNLNGYTQPYYQNVVEVEYASGTEITYSGAAFTGVLWNPFLIAPGTSLGVAMVTLMRFGALTHGIDFSQPVTIRMPVLGQSIGSVVSIYSSNEDVYGTNNPAWNLEQITTVINIGGIPYIEFTTMHATFFSIIGGFTGSFMINNDDASTTSDNVTLNISGTGIQNMRFQNDGTGGSRSTREAYATSTGRTLSTGYGTKTVYAQFDVDGDTGTVEITTSDDIEYSSGGGGIGGGNITGNIRLDITSTASGACTYGTSLYLGSHAVQFAAFDMTGAEFPTPFECVDTYGLANRTMTMQASGDLTNGSQTISKSNVSMIANTNYVSAGACTAGVNQITWTSIGASPATILNKSGVLNDICTITATGVNLAVHIPSNQAVGTYTGTLSLDMPF